MIDQSESLEELEFLMSLKETDVIPYLMRIQKLIKIGLPTTCGYQHVGVCKDYKVRARFVQSIFSLPLHHNSMHHFFGWSFIHFTVIPILEGIRVWCTTLNSNIQFLIAAWGSSGGPSEEKAKREKRRNDRAKLRKIAIEKASR
jgi:hypothetical protein